MWDNLTPGHFGRAKAENRRHRAELDARYAEESRRLDEEYAAIEADEKEAAVLAERYADGSQARIEGNGGDLAPIAPSSLKAASGKEKVRYALRELTDSQKGATRAEIAAYLRRIDGGMPDSSITTYLGRLRKKGDARLRAGKWHGLS